MSIYFDRMPAFYIISTFAIILVFGELMETRFLSNAYHNIPISLLFLKLIIIIINHPNHQSSIHLGFSKRDDFRQKIYCDVMKDQSIKHCVRRLDATKQIGCNCNANTFIND